MATSPTTSAQSRFLSLLKNSILKLDLAELDFGIYRILNYRRAQILGFLDDTLPARIGLWTAALAAASGHQLADTEADNCYYHLHTFFARYWDEGDFIPRARRGGSAAYAVPYHGQDTHFHWATKGSHYVKSGELFTRYAYKDGSTEVHFVIEQADIAKDNVKGAAKNFFPSKLLAIDGGFELRWQWRAASDAEAKRYKNKSVARSNDAGDGDSSSEPDAEDPTTDGATLQERVLNAWLSGADFKTAKPLSVLNPLLLASNARRFVRKNTSDFFVHPHLGEFLRGEIDVYLKHEFVQVWDAPDAELPRVRAKFKLVRQIALDLITFLDQIETFQATLFEKRKFVLQADYLVQCSWLMREAGEAGRALVAEACANEAQVKEWAQWVGDKAKKPNGKKLLAAYPHLPLHTQHFNADFKARVLACFDDIETALGGELIHADNYAALRTLESAYRERVKCIYIDPPYNVPGSEIPYKNEFLHSSWISLVAGRIEAAFKLTSADGAMCITIDDYEKNNLLSFIESAGKSEDILGIVCIRNNPSGRSTVKGFAVNHEYAIFIAASSQHARLGRLQHTTAQRARYDLLDEDGQSYELENMRKSSAESLRADRPKQHFVIYVDRRTLAVRIPQQTWREASLSWDIDEPPKLGETKVLPNGSDGIERVWSIGYERAQSEVTELTAKREDTVFQIYKRKYLNEDGVLPRTWWDKPEYSARDNGTRVLRDMFGRNQPFEFPKAIAAVVDCLKVTGLVPGSIGIDFFAGSATTGHAVINLNREDGGARKFLLVEQGEYFDSVTLPRIAKVMTAPEWKDGQPKDSVNHNGSDPDHWSRRTLPLVRVLKLERYEDSLNALDFEQNATAASAEPVQAAMEFVAQDEQSHLLRYWLMNDSEGAPVRLSTDKLNDPFAYQLTLHEPTGERLAQVDLLETARLLLGLCPKKQRELNDTQGQRHQLMEAVLASDLARGASSPAPMLLWLRPVLDERTEQAAQAEYEWLAQAVQTQFGRALTDYATVFHNRAAFWPAGLQPVRGQSIDTLLAERMMERAR